MRTLEFGMPDVHEYSFLPPDLSYFSLYLVPLVSEKNRNRRTSLLCLIELAFL